MKQEQPQYIFRARQLNIHLQYIPPLLRSCLYFSVCPLFLFFFLFCNNFSSAVLLNCSPRMSYQKQAYTTRISADRIAAPKVWITVFLCLHSAKWLPQRACMMTGEGWKRLSVFISICLAAAALAVGAIVALRPLDPSTLKGQSQSDFAEDQSKL
jgi:hypothetical protein